MPQMWRPVHALQSTKVSSVNSVLADTHVSRLMEDLTSRVYHAGVMDTQTRVILRLECAWTINTSLQVWTYRWPWQYYVLSL